MLKEDAHKDTEDEVISRFKNGTLGAILKSPKFQKDVKKVWRTYDQIGLLVNKNLIPKKEFYHLFGLKMVSVYFCLSSEIEQRRLTRPFSLMYFTNMAIDCWEYWNKKGKEIFNPATNGAIKRNDLGERIES